MKKLTLEHISPFLPYGLKVLHTEIDNTGGSNTQIVTLSTAGEECLTFCDDFHGASDYHFDSDENPQIKPILRPIFDIKKDEMFNTYLDLCESLEMVRCDSLIDALINNTYYALDIRKYPMLEDFMYKNHFDWKHDLIAAGLAVDVNTLEINPYK